MKLLWLSYQVFVCPILIMALYLDHGESMTHEIRFPTRISPKIVGGHNFQRRHLPFSYIVNIQDIALNRSICGGTILDNTTILTAAHVRIHNRILLPLSMHQVFMECS